MPNNLPLDQAIEHLELESRTLEIPTLDGIDAPTVYELGFATAVKHLKDITGPGQMEVSVITMDVPESAIADWEEKHPGVPYPFDATPATPEETR